MVLAVDSSDCVCVIFSSVPGSDDISACLIIDCGGYISLLSRCSPLSPTVRCAGRRYDPRMLNNLCRPSVPEPDGLDLEASVVLSGTVNESLAYISCKYYEGKAMLSGA